MKRTEQFMKGDKVRRAVLGDEFVDNSFANADDYSREMFELSTEYCWGAVWAREGLSHKTRSIVNLAMLSALNRPHELKLHVSGALRNGVTKDEIKEILLQVAIYCGIPAGVDGFRNAKDAIREYEEKNPKP